MRSQIQHHAGVHVHRHEPPSINAVTIPQRGATRPGGSLGDGIPAGTPRPAWEHVDGMDPTP